MGGGRREGPQCAHQCFGIRICLLVQQNLGNLVMATVSGYMKCGQVVVGHIIYGYVVLNQELNAVEMVPLGRHVQWRQAILEVEREGAE